MTEFKRGLAAALAVAFVLIAVVQAINATRVAKTTVISNTAGKSDKQPVAKVKQSTPGRSDGCPKQKIWEFFCLQDT